MAYMLHMVNIPVALCPRGCRFTEISLEDGLLSRSSTRTVPSDSCISESGMLILIEISPVGFNQLNVFASLFT